MIQATPYLLFGGNCAEAMKFYHKALGGELTIVKAADTPMKDQFPPQMHDLVMQAELKKDGITLSSSDWFRPEEKAVRGNTVCVYLTGLNYSELTKYFKALVVGAASDLTEKPHELPFGTYAALTDKFGVRWMFRGEKPAK